MNTAFKKSTLAIALTVMSIAAFAQNILVDSKKSYSGIKKIEIESGWLDVTYKGSGASEVNVEAFLESNNSDQDIVFVTVGDVLKISHTRKQSNYNWNSRNKGYLNITGPKELALEVRGSSGNITVDNVSNDRTDVRVTSGKISVTKSRVICQSTPPPEALSRRE